MLALFVALFTLAGPALAGDGASAPPPTPPEVDFSSLPDSAAQRKNGLDGKPHPVLARLLVDRTALAQGSKARIGLHLEQDEGWHTYWKSPGDIGQPTEIAWSAPDGVSIEAHEYPVPQRFDQSGEVSFGYDGEVLLISEVEVAEDAPLGEHTIEAKANWLVCKSTCIKGDAEVSLPVTVVAEAAGTESSSFAALFDHYEAQHPDHALDVKAFGWDYSLSVAEVPADGRFRAVFLFTPTTDVGLAREGDALWPTFTPIVPSDWSYGLLEAPRVTQLDDGRVLVVMDAEAYEPDPIPTGARIGGLVQLKAGDDWVRTEVSGSVPFKAAGSPAEAVASPLITLAQEHFPLEGGEVLEAAVGGGGGEIVEPATGINKVSLPMGMLFGFLGGLILNVMPCVLPVLFLKLFGLVEQADVTNRDRRNAGIAYTGGILVSFWVLAGLIIVLKTMFGANLGWGFQFQYPEYVAALATVVFVFGLSLFGVFEIPAFGVNAASDAASREGPLGYFLYGVFAVLLATPCSAPLLGPAIAYAFSATPVELTVIFSMIALGLASPFLLIAFVPVLFDYLPKPGEWMETIKQFLGFTLVITTVWLVGVLAEQIGADRTMGFLAFLTAASLGAWVFGRFGGVAATAGRQAGSLLVALLITAAAGYAFLDFEFAEPECDDGSLATAEELEFEGEIPWQPFSEERVAALAGTPVFIDFTADWCLTCKVNERTVLETASVREAMQEHGVVPLKADWTRRDEVITEWLRRFERAGVPMYIVIPGDPAKKPILLPETITPGMVIAALKEAT